MSASSENRVLHFDIIRILACLAVILFHFNVYFLYADPSLPRLGDISYFNQTVGDIAISLFIILSGVSLSISQRDDDFKMGDFYKKRFLSIFPSFWISYIIVAVFFISFGVKFGDGNIWKLLLSFFGMDGFFLYKMTNYYLVGEWYTGFMLITYLLYPILKVIFDKSPTYCWLTVLLIFTVLNAYYNRLFDVYINCNPLMRMPDFLFGITFSKYIFRHKNRERLLAALGVVILIFHEYIYIHLSSQAYMFIFGASFFSVLAYVISLIRIHSILSKVIVKISGLTFLAFLFHHQIIYGVFKFIDFRTLDTQKKMGVFLFCVFSSFYIAKEVSPLVKRFTNFLKNRLNKVLANNDSGVGVFR